ASEDQSDAVAVVGQSVKPIAGLATIGRIQPDAAMPRLAKAVSGNVEMALRRVPGPAISGRTRIEVELAKRGDHFRRRQPFILQHGGRLVAAHSLAVHHAATSPNRSSNTTPLALNSATIRSV